MAELSGQILVYNDSYESVTESDVIKAHREACQGPFEAVKDKVSTALEIFGPLGEDDEASGQSRAVREEVDLASSEDESSANGQQVKVLLTTTICPKK